MAPDTIQDLNACINAVDRLNTTPGAEYRFSTPDPDETNFHNHLSKFAILIPIRRAHALKAKGIIGEEGYREVFDQCWTIVADNSGCAEDMAISDALIDMLDTLGMTPEGYAFERRGGGLGRWF